MTTERYGKITFIGKAGMGKTTIKKVIFQGEDPNELVIFPLEATIGIKYSVHNYMDSKVSLIDTPGQSMQLILEDEEKQIFVFENANAIIYIFDYPTWISDSQDIIDDIKKIYEINKKRKFGAKIVLFMHKVDLLINKKIGSRLDIIKHQIIRQLSLPEELPIYFTSLHPNLIYTIYNALSDTISYFSEDNVKLKDIIMRLINGLAKTSCFVTNQEDNIIIQVFSEDFDTSLLYYLYESIYRLNTSSEFTSSEYNLVNLGPKLLHIAEKNISEFHSNFKNVMIFSETLEKNDMIEIIDKLKKELNQYY